MLLSLWQLCLISLHECVEYVLGFSVGYTYYIFLLQKCFWKSILNAYINPYVQVLWKLRLGPFENNFWCSWLKLLNLWCAILSGTGREGKPGQARQSDGFVLPRVLAKAREPLRARRAVLLLYIDSSLWKLSSSTAEVLERGTYGSSRVMWTSSGLGECLVW